MADEALAGQISHMAIPGPDIGCQSRRFPLPRPGGMYSFCHLALFTCAFSPLNPAGPDALFNLQPNFTKSCNTQHSLMGLTLVVAGYILVISFLSFMNALWLLPELGHCSGWRLHHENDGISHRPTPLESA